MTFPQILWTQAKDEIVTDLCSGLKDICLLLAVPVLPTHFITQGLLTTAKKPYSVM